MTKAIPLTQGKLAIVEFLKKQRMYYYIRKAKEK